MSGEQTLAAAILDLHKPWYEVRGKRAAHRVLVGDDDVPKDHICHISGFDACSPEEHYVDACIECRQMDEDCGPASLLWPCPTAQLALSDDAARQRRTRVTETEESR